jgi:hypothetical protein
MIADESRRQADVFADLVELRSKIGRDPSDRSAPRDSRHRHSRGIPIPPDPGEGDDEDFEDR